MVFVFFLATVKQNKTGDYTYRWPMHAHHPLCSTHLYGCSIKAKVARSENRVTKFIPARWDLMHGSILVSPCQDMRKGDEKTKNNMHTLLDQD